MYATGAWLPSNSGWVVTEVDPLTGENNTAVAPIRAGRGGEFGSGPSRFAGCRPQPPFGISTLICGADLRRRFRQITRRGRRAVAWRRAHQLHLSKPLAGSRRGPLVLARALPGRAGRRGFRTGALNRVVSASIAAIRPPGCPRCVRGMRLAIPDRGRCSRTTGRSKQTSIVTVGWLQVLGTRPAASEGFNLWTPKVSDIDTSESREDEPERSRLSFHAAIPRSARVALQVSF